MQRLSIRIKLTLMMAAASTVGLVLIAAAFIIRDGAFFRMSMQRDLETLASVLGANSAAPLAFKDGKFAAELLATVHNVPEVTAAALYDDDGKRFAEYRRDDVPQGAAVLTRGSDGVTFGPNLAIARRTIRLDGERVGVLVIEADLGGLKSRMNSHVAVAAVVLIAALIVVLLLSTQLQRIISQPILHLAPTTRRLSAEQDYSIRATHGRDDEIGVLIS